MTTTPPIVYSVGTLVEVDNTKTGYIIEIDDTNDDITRFKISYRVGNEIEVGVHQSRCRPVSLRRASSSIHTRDYLRTPRGLPFPRQHPPFLQRCVRPEQTSGTDHGPSREDGTEDTDFGGGCGGRCGG